MAERIEFVTMVKMRPGAGAQTSDTGGYDAAAWHELKRAIERIGGHIYMVKNVLGNDYDVLMLGDTTSAKTLHQIDATCKTLGYEAKTHPAIEATEYTALAIASAQVVHLTPRRS